MVKKSIGAWWLLAAAAGLACLSGFGNPAYARRAKDGEKASATAARAPRVAAEASAAISSVTLRLRRPWTGWVDVDYTLETAPEGQTATVSLSGLDLDRRKSLVASTLAGDGANGEPVEAGTHRLSWNVAADHPGFHAKEFSVSMDATPWKPAAFRGSQYAVVDMSGGTSAAVWPVEWLDEPPDGGFNTDEYKTVKLVLRRIEPGTFTMGSPTGELGRWDTENQHEVTLTKPYYIGLFEVTQRQWELATGTRPSFFANDSCYATRPVEKVSYADIRGSVAGTGWPADNDVDAASFLGILREKTGLTLDLPTEAQWEWACRAGTATALYSGKELTGANSCPNVAELGRYLCNGGQGGVALSDLSAGTAAAGSYLPNAWGLHDMLGNVNEWCLDWLSEHLTTAATNPVGPVHGTYRTAHGGGWDLESRFSRAAMRGWHLPTDRLADYGFRLACAAGGKRVQRVTFASVAARTIGARVKLSATATSGGPVTFSVVSGPGLLDGNILTFTDAGTVTVSATQAGDDIWEAATATLAVTVSGSSPGMGRLLHRWSFNGDFEDSIGGQTGVYSGSADCEWRADGKAVSLAGGTHGNSGVCLGKNAVPTDDSPVTIEIWGTQREALWQARMFEWTSGMDQSYQASWFIMGWCRKDDVSRDQIVLWRKGGDSLNARTAASLWTEPALAPYSLGTEYHISVVIEPNRDGDGRTHLRFAKHDAATGQILAQTSDYVRDDWVPSMFAGNELWLGRSSFPNDRDAAADFDEVRIWNAALSDEQLSRNARLGPDVLPDGEDDPTPPVSGDLAEGLVAWYAFDGDARDSSENGNHGTVHGATLAAGRDGKADGAYHFDGESSIVVPNTAVFQSIKDAFSLSVWLRCEQPSNGRFVPIVCKGTDSNGRQFGLTLDKLGDVAIFGVEQSVALDGFPPANVWNHLAATLDEDGTATFYLNGEVLGTGHTSNELSVNTQDLVIGADPHGLLERLYGFLDDLAVWNRALTAEEVARLYAGEKPVARYLVVDLSGGPEAECWPVEYLTGEPEGGFNTDEYKTTKLVLRRIEPGRFAMGSPDSELGRWSSCETQHPVTLTQPYYIAVFEMTQRQWELATGTRPSFFANPDYWATRPVDSVSFEMLRGSNAGERWPLDNAVDKGSFIAVMREKTGLPFELPTEAQWEYACRAGTTAALNSGKDLTSSWSCPNLAEVARYGHGGSGCNESSDLSKGSMTVGSCLPNAWGLYDMLGNQWEWCLDWYVADLGTAAVTDPVGPASGKARLYRGGCWNDCARYCRSAYRYSHGHVPTDAEATMGVRLACSTDAKRMPTVAAPVIQPGDGTTFEGNLKRVRISCATAGAVIRYTLDGSVPGERSTLYEGSFNVFDTTTVRARAFADEMLPSAVATARIERLRTLAEAIDQPLWSVSADEERPWTVARDAAHDGICSARSGVISDAESSRMWAVVEGAGTLSFWWKVDCEDDPSSFAGWDYAAFSVDGVEMARMDGDSGWVRFEKAIAGSGAHTLEWKYCKDDFDETETEDAMWVDEVAWEPTVGELDVPVS